jgi:ribosomal protein L11 methyltransferase
VQVEQGSLRQISDLKSQISKDASQSSDLKFDIVLVNILAKIIVELCGQGLSGVVRPGGLVIFAGLIDTQEAEVREALKDAGLTVIERMQPSEKDWVGLVCQSLEGRKAHA